MKIKLSSIFNARALVAATMIAIASTAPIHTSPAQAQGWEDQGPQVEDRTSLQDVYQDQAIINNQASAPADVERAFENIRNKTTHAEYPIRQAAISALIYHTQNNPHRLDTVLDTLSTLADDPSWQVRSGMVGTMGILLTLDDASGARVMQILRDIMDTRNDTGNQYVLSSVASAAATIAKNVPATQEAAMAIFTALAADSTVDGREAAAQHVRPLISLPTTADRAMALLMTLAYDSEKTVINISIGQLTLVATQISHLAPPVMQSFDDMLTDDNIDLRIRVRAAIGTVSLRDPRYIDRAVTVMDQGLQMPEAAEAIQTLNTLMIMGRAAGQPHKDQIVALLTRTLDDSRTDVSVDASARIVDVVDGNPAYADPLLRAAHILKAQPETNRLSSALQGARELAIQSTQHNPQALALIADMMSTSQTVIQTQVPTSLKEIAIAQPSSTAHIISLLQQPGAHQTTAFYVAATKAQSEIAPLYPTHVTSIRDYMFTGLAARTDDGALVALAEALGVIGALDDTQAAAVIPELLQPHNLAKPALHAPAAAALGQIGAARTQFATPVFDALVTLNNTADNAGRIGIVKAMSAMALQGNQWVQPTLTHMEAMIPGSNTPLLTAMADVLVPIAERHARFSNEIARILNVMQQSANGSAASKIRSALNDVREVQQLFNQQNHGQTRARLESELPAALTNEAAARAMWPDAQSLTQAPDAVTRRKAAEILTQLGRTYGGLAAEGVTTLATLNKDMDPGVRLAVTQGLGMLGMQNPALAADILVALQPLTLDTDPMVAGLAVNAVGMLGARNPDLTDEATAILTPAAQSTDTMVRGNANNHLQKLAP